MITRAGRRCALLIGRSTGCSGTASRPKVSDTLAVLKQVIGATFPAVVVETAGPEFVQGLRTKGVARGGNVTDLLLLFLAHIPLGQLLINLRHVSIKRVDGLGRTHSVVASESHPHANRRSP